MSTIQEAAKEYAYNHRRSGLKAKNNIKVAGPTEQDFIEIATSQAAKEYWQKQLGASESPSKGIKWVKASEFSFEDGIEVFYRIPANGNKGICRYDEDKKTLEYFVYGEWEAFDNIEWVNDNVLILDESPESDPSNPVKSNYKYLIERMDTHQWYCFNYFGYFGYGYHGESFGIHPDPKNDWTKDANEAFKFDKKETAEKFLTTGEFLHDINSRYCIVTEHEFVDYIKKCNCTKDECCSKCLPSPSNPVVDEGWISECKEVIELLLKRNRELYSFADMPWEDYSGQNAVVRGKEFVNRLPKPPNT